MFSKSSKELVSTHGYSDNAIVVWKYPSMKKISTLTGHSLRVLYLAMSPDAETIVTGAGDETLRFWKVFPKNNKTKGCSMSSTITSNHLTDNLSTKMATIR
jgi:cell division cycle 20-like protein 1 (cofactor of APC complex)